MMRILFVDDEPKLLRGLARALCDLDDEWEMAFAESGEEALEVLENDTYDVIVSDMRMPRMNGAQLLSEVRRRHPQTVRIVLSGHSDKDLVMQSLECTHQYLAKPCDLEQLHDVVMRAFALRRLLAKENIRALVSQTQSLPSLPQLYTAVMKEIRDPRGSIRKVGELISRDIAMTGKVLQIVNSAYFGLPREVSDPAQAVTLLGFENVRAMILVAHVFSRLDDASLDRVYLERLWEHSIAVSAQAKHIACAEAVDEHTRDHAMIAGLLHDTGRLILAICFPDRYRRMTALMHQEPITLVDAEERVFGCTHPEVGAYLFGLWGLPDPVVEAVAFHHHPERCPATGFTPLTAVHAADAIRYEPVSNGRKEALPVFSREYLDRLGLMDRFRAWREIGREPAPQGAHA